MQSPWTIPLVTLSICLSALAQVSNTTTRPLPACPGAPESRYPLVVAEGWSVTPVLGNLTRPRSIIVDTHGHLLIAEVGKGISAHTLDDAGCVIKSTLLINDTTLNHAVELSPRGRRLFASSSDIAWSWEYNAANLTVSNRKTLVHGMHNPGHVTRTLHISRRYPNLLMVSVGSDGNIDEAAIDPTSGTAQIRVFDLRTLPEEGVAYTSGEVLGYGIRNDVAIAEDREGTIFSVENSADNVFRRINGTTADIHTNNPAEKVYKLGSPKRPTGLFGGYPYCLTVWEEDDFLDSVKQPGDWFTQAPNDTINDAWCDANAQKPVALLPPHTAPLDSKFSPNRNDTNLYVSLHGSWNRDPPQGYKVVTIPGNVTKSGGWSPSVDLAETKTNFSDILANTDESRCADGCFRPVGLAFTKGGDWLYVASDASQEIVIMKRTTRT